MKKIININLSGRVIPIEDSAYEKLQAYIESLRRYFANEDGRDEIINDIESRIAELMNDKVRKGAACVTDADIEEIMHSMGRPEDFDAEEQAAADAAQTSAKKAQFEDAYNSNSSGRKSRGRLYRDASDKFIGGVCSGIANYLNVDPAIIRILFAIITFGGFGVGFLIYILLWIVLPTKDLDHYGGKRLYRNPDDRIIGGVAGGLGAYFNMRVSTLRLIFAAPLLLSIIFGMFDWLTWNYDYEFFPNILFSSLSGTVFLAYIILWIVLPEARGPYEKMEMRGEKVDVNTIRQNVQEGMDTMKDRVKTFSEEVSASAKSLGKKTTEYAKSYGKTFATEVNQTARQSGRGIGHAIGVLFKVFFLFIAGTIAFGLFVAMIALLFSGAPWSPVNNFIWTSKSQQLYAWGTVIFFLVVPVVALILWIIRRSMRVRSRSSYLGWTFGALWTAGWVCLVMLIVSFRNDINYTNVDNERQVISTNIALAHPAGSRLIVAVTEPEVKYSGRFGWINDEPNGWDISDDSMRLSNVKFTFAKSLDANFHVMLRKYAWGESWQDVRERSEKIQYRVVSSDSILDLGSSFAIDRASKYRGQFVEVLIQVPVGKKIRFDQSVKDKLNPPIFSRNRSEVVRVNGRVVTRRDYDDYDFQFRSNEDYTMGNDEKLRDSHGTIVDYSYNAYDDYDAEPDSIRLRLQYEENKRRFEQSERELREEQERARRKAADDSIHRNDRGRDSVKESMEDRDDETAGSGNPSVFSLVKWM